MFKKETAHLFGATHFKAAEINLLAEYLCNMKINSDSRRFEMLSIFN